MVQTRDKKSHLELPPDFVVSTNLHVTHDSGKQVTQIDITKFGIYFISLFLSFQPNENFRSGRSFGSSR